MFLEIKTPGYGFVEGDVGRMVKLNSLTDYVGEPGAYCERNVWLVTTGTLFCGLRSFMEDGASYEEVKEFDQQIRSEMVSKLVPRSCAFDVQSEQPTEPLKSDGGSSLYYDLPIPQRLLDTLTERSEQGSCYIKTEEIITHLLSNSFDYGNLFKSLVRCKGLQEGTGGKAGNSVDYECNKMSYSVEKIREMGNNKEKQ